MTENVDDPKDGSGGATDHSGPDRGDEETDSERARTALGPSRRAFLRATAATGVFGLSGVGAAQDGVDADFVLGGETAGWVGRQPAEIEGQTNPTLTLQPGEPYVVEWENADGQPHNFAILDADGGDLVRSEIINEQGATQTVEFEATEEMAEYYCEVHPTTMRGSVELGSSDGGEGGEGNGEGEQPTDDAEGAGFFSPGTTVGVETVAEGMVAPTDMAVAEGEDRYFVTDQTGEVYAVTGEGLGDGPFVDVSDRMVTLGEFDGTYANPESEYDERGLLGIELHPEFAENGLFYLHYSAPRTDEMPENWDHIQVISEFSTSDDGESGDPDSERRLLEIEHPQYNHDSGPMAFGPDGYLYVPMGDGGGADDDMYGHVEDWYDGNAGGNGQDVTENLLGSVLRIDVDQEGEDTPYAIPEDNPLVGTDGLDEQYAWGFRNPFGIAFDSQDRMFVADAGQNLFEEANVVERGGNYGWNVKEGTHCFSTDDPANPPEECPASAPDEAPYDGQELTDPIVEYPHTYNDQQVGIVIVGGYFYENDTIPGLRNKYVFGDWSRDVAREQPLGRLFAAADPEAATGATDGATTGGTDGDAGGGTTTKSPGEGATDVPRDDLWEMEELVVEGGEGGELGYFVRMFGQDTEGEIYVLANRRGAPAGDTGVVLKLVPPGEGEDVTADGDATTADE